MIIDGFLSGFPLKQSDERRTGSGQVASYGCQMDPKNWSLARIEHAPTCYSLPRVDKLLALNPKSLQIEIIEKIVIRHIFRRLKSSANLIAFVSFSWATSLHSSKMVPQNGSTKWFHRAALSGSVDHFPAAGTTPTIDIKDYYLRYNIYIYINHHYIITINLS